MFDKALKRLASALDKAKLPYMVIGGQAVMIYGEPRFTRDIDITLGVGTERLDQILSVCKKLSLKPLVRDIKHFVEQTMTLPAMDGETGVRVDFMFSFTPYEEEAIRRTRKIKIKGRAVHFASPEDVIIHKIFAGRPRDTEDVRSILLASHSLDVGYIKRWLKEFDKTFPGKNYLRAFKKIQKIREDV